MRYLLLALVMVACAPAETPAPDAAPVDANPCTPACATGQVCVGGTCFAPVDAGVDVAADASPEASLDAGPEASVDAVADGPTRDLDPRCTPPTHIWCGGFCNDPETSNLHCGRCGNACIAPETCFMGRCARP